MGIAWRQAAWSAHASCLCFVLCWELLQGTYMWRRQKLPHPVVPTLCGSRLVTQHTGCGCSVDQILPSHPSLSKPNELAMGARSTLSPPWADPFLRSALGWGLWLCTWSLSILSINVSGMGGGLGPPSAVPSCPVPCVAVILTCVRGFSAPLAQWNQPFLPAGHGCGSSSGIGREAVSQPSSLPPRCGRVVHVSRAPVRALLGRHWWCMFS